jgi:hypothetical protein
MAHDDDPIPLVTERFQRRLGEECGRLRLEMAAEFAKFRVEIINRNAYLLRWLLVIFVTQTAIIATLLRLFR